MNIMRRPDYLDWQNGMTEPAPFHWLPAMFSLLRRRWMTIAACVLVFLAIGVTYYLVATAQFTAMTSILIDTRRGDLFKQQQSSQGDASMDSAIVESQVEVLKSEGIARRVARSMRLADDREFMSWGRSLSQEILGVISLVLDTVHPTVRAASADDHDSSAVEILVRMTTVRRIGLSDIIELTVRTPDAGRSSALANGLTAAFIDEQLDAKYDTTRRAGGWLQDRLKELRDQSIAADQAVQDYRAKFSIVDTDKGSMNDQQLGDLSTQLATARAQTSETASRYNQIQAIKASGVTVTLTVTDAIQNTVILKLQQQYLDDQRRLAEWAVKYGANHAATIGVRTEMAGLQKAIQTEIARMYDSYENDYSVAKNNEAAIQRQISQLVEQSGEKNSEHVALRSLQSLADTYRSLYGTFLQRYSQAVQDQTFPIAEARVVTPAVAPLHKSWPAALIVLAGSLVAGLAVGFGLALAREILDQRLRTPAQVRDATGLDTLAQLPQLYRKDYAPRRGFTEDGVELRQRARALSARASILRVATDSPFSPFAEALRGIRVRIAQRHARSPAFRVIGVVSVGANEGKSTVAANLAHTLAASGSKTILLDWDLRRTTLTNTLAFRNEGGFTDLASGTASLTAAIWHDPNDGMAFLPATSGKVSTQAVEVLGSERTKATLDALRTSHDYAVVDLPALGAVMDAQAVAHLIDGFIVVVEWGEARQDSLVDCLSQAGFEDDKVLGVVFNKVDLATAKRLDRVATYGYRPLVRTAPAVG